MKFLESWNVLHNFALIIIGFIIILTTLAVTLTNTSHREHMEHIKRGHCQIQSIGNQSLHWAICK